MALTSLLRQTGHLSRAQLFSLAMASPTKITFTASAQSTDFSMAVSVPPNHSHLSSHYEWLPFEACVAGPGDAVA